MSVALAKRKLLLHYQHERFSTTALFSLPASVSTASLSQPIPLTVGDCRGLVKTLVCGMKTITWGVGSCKVPGSTVDFCEWVGLL